MDQYALLMIIFIFVFETMSYALKPALELDVTPRTTVLYSGLIGAQRYRSSAVNYSVFLLEDKAGILYVGARGAVFALNTSNIANGKDRMIYWEASMNNKTACWKKGKDNKTECFNHVRFLQRFNETHLYICGTYAFHPLCTYIDKKEFRLSSQFEEGKEKCPYDPSIGYTGLFVDGEMYTATQYDFHNVPDIRRNFPYPVLKTETIPTRWLYEADFVGSALVRESINSSIGDDDKIYFFFTEKSNEENSFFKQLKVARVARICKGDWGGRRTLQTKWTSFLKARLVCSIPDYDFHFNILRSIYKLEDGGDWQNIVFYGVFGSQWKNVKASAVCQYSIKDIQKVFNGPYVENQDTSLKWNEHTGEVPQPRPGACITDEFREKGYNTSTDLPDNVLNFVRRHPLMFQQVRPMENRPLLFKRNVDYTRIAVQRVIALDKQTYNVLFIGTDDGWLHKAVEIGSQIHIIEEMQLFEQPQPVENIVISKAQRSLYVGSQSSVLQLPFSACQRYTSCFECIFARDPYCGWNEGICVDITIGVNRVGSTQDVQNGKLGCQNSTAQDNIIHKRRTVLKGDDVLLQCELSSNLATPRWKFGGQDIPIYGKDGYRIGTDGLLIVESRVEHTGNYSCYAMENNILFLVATYTVQVRSEFPPETVKPTIPPTQNESTTQTLPVDPPKPEYQTFRTMEAMYISLITVLAGLCFVLTVVLLYLAFCSQPHQRKRMVQGSGRNKRRGGSLVELQTISSNCSNKQDGHISDGFLQIVPGEGQVLPNKDPPPPPPLPPPPPASEFANGLSATLPSVLRKMNGNSYVLLRQSEPESTSPHYYPFTEELNKMLEKRKHLNLLQKPDESSV
ncbi:semaphorin-4G-like [Polypterus senegalus]|uniref:semaphorin-4G-like n=1 Tax=Polypterus senegalus TaxID=55291 RepID=UPI0019637660|nr:semaphorin-4G-like [Polypterus senegalus]